MQVDDGFYCAWTAAEAASRRHYEEQVLLGLIPAENKCFCKCASHYVQCASGVNYGLQVRVLVPRVRVQRPDAAPGPAAGHAHWHAVLRFKLGPRPTYLCL